MSAIERLIAQVVVNGGYISMELKDDIEHSLLALNDEELINVLKTRKVDNSSASERFSNLLYWEEIMPDPYKIFCACDNRQSVCEWIVENILEVSYEEEMEDYYDYDHPEWHVELYKKWVEKRQVAK